LADHLGNVLLSVIDRFWYDGVTNNTYFADVTEGTMYYSYGAVGKRLMLARERVTQGNRYGFNGKENDFDRTKLNEGPQWQDYGMRMYDARLARFASVDPIAKDYPWNSPYSFAESDPISSIDLDGLERYVVTNYRNRAGKITRTEVTTITEKSTKKLVNLQVLKLNNLLTSNDVLVLDVDHSGKALREYGKSTLNKWERQVLEKGAKEQLYKEPKFFVYFNDDETVRTAREDFTGQKYSAVISSSDVPKLPSSVNLPVNGGFYIGLEPQLGPNGNQVPNGSFEPNSAGGREVSAIVERFGSQLVNNPNLSRVTISVSGIVGLNSSADPKFSEYQRGLQNIASNLRRLLINQGVDPGRIFIAPPTSQLASQTGATPTVNATISVTTK
jgi:RHS repeat-associated protein